MIGSIAFWERITLAEIEKMRRFATYFPHVDNIYSHRSTQRYKRKPFMSHYWDCRLKGRPPGTRKSDDPNKRKRKRQARERDLCDVKIKVTEYFPGANRQMAEENIESNMELPANGNNLTSDSPGGLIQPQVSARPFGTLESNEAGSGVDVPGSDGRRYYTIQRVNGNGGNGKFDGTAGPHKHTLEESDRVKKNSVLRQLIMEEKANKKTQVSNPFRSGFHAAGKCPNEGFFQRPHETPHYCMVASLDHLGISMYNVDLSSSVSSPADLGSDMRIDFLYPTHFQFSIPLFELMTAWGMKLKPVRKHTTGRLLVLR